MKHVIFLSGGGGVLTYLLTYLLTALLTYLLTYLLYFINKNQVSKNQMPALRKGWRKQPAQGQVARARGLRKELAQAIAQATRASNAHSSDVY